MTTPEGKSVVLITDATEGGKAEREGGRNIK